MENFFPLNNDYVLLFFCNTCLIHVLEECCDDLHKRMLSPMDLAALKIEYQELCGVVELADNLLAPLLLHWDGYHVYSCSSFQFL